MEHDTPLPTEVIHLESHVEVPQTNAEMRQFVDSILNNVPGTVSVYTYTEAGSDEIETWQQQAEQQGRNIIIGNMPQGGYDLGEVSTNDHPLDSDIASVLNDQRSLGAVHGFLTEELQFEVRHDKTSPSGEPVVRAVYGLGGIHNPGAPQEDINILVIGVDMGLHQARVLQEIANTNPSVPRNVFAAAMVELGIPENLGGDTNPFAIAEQRDHNFDVFDIHIPSTEPGSAGAERINRRGQKDLRREFGALALQHNKEKPGKSDPSDGGKFNAISPALIKLHGKNLVRDARNSNETARKLDAKLEAALAKGDEEKAAETRREIDAHNEKVQKNILDVEGKRIDPLVYQVKKRGKLQQRLAKDRIAQYPARGTPERTAMLERLQKRNEVAKARAVGNFPEVDMPTGLADLPKNLQTEYGQAVLRDIRDRLTQVTELAEKQAIAKGESWGSHEEKRVRANHLKRLTAGNFYKNYGGNNLKLRDPDVAALVEQLTLLDDDDFEQLVPPAALRQVR